MLGLRNRHVPWLAGLVATAALAMPAAASAADGAIRVVHSEEVTQRFMDASGTNINDNSVTIAPGERVTFSYPDAVPAGSHNVDFSASTLKPTECTLTQGTVIPGFPYAIPGFLDGRSLVRVLHVQHRRARTTSSARHTRSK